MWAVNLSVIVVYVLIWIVPEEIFTWAQSNAGQAGIKIGDGSGIQIGPSGSASGVGIQGADGSSVTTGLEFLDQNNPPMRALAAYFFFFKGDFPTCKRDSGDNDACNKVCEYMQHNCGFCHFDNWTDPITNTSIEATQKCVCHQQHKFCDQKWYLRRKRFEYDVDLNDTVIEKEGETELVLVE